MTSAKENLPDKNQPKTKRVSQMESLLKLLVDLEVVNPKKERKSQVLSHSDEETVEEHRETQVQPQLLNEQAASVSQSILAESDLQHLEDLVPVLLNLLMPKIAEILSDREAELKSSVTGAIAPVIESVSIYKKQEEKIEIIEDKLSRVERQIYGGEELTNIVMPQISELLICQEAELKSLIAAAIAPLIESAHLQKKQDEKIGSIEERLAQSERRIDERQEHVNIMMVQIEEILKRQESEFKSLLAAAIAPINEFISNSKKQEEKIESIEDKVVMLAESIYESKELSNLILPLMPELLRLTIAQSRESVTSTIAPIIDEVIANKTQKNRISMGHAIAPAMPVAITRQISSFPEEIAHAIAPEMAAAIKKQIELEREAMSDALYPIIGSTIVKYIGETIREINEKIENAFSLEGISRKFRANMQGVSEAELLLKETMPFTVKAVFLIHKASGLVISEVQSGSDRLESDMVAGMLTAIRTFVNDCIAQSGNVSEIDEIDYGNSKIVLEVAGYCYLAVVVQGEPNQLFIRKMRQTLGTIVQDYGKIVNGFDGDSANIPERVNSLLLGLTDTYSKVRASKPSFVAIATSVVLSLILLLWGIFQYR